MFYLNISMSGRRFEQRLEVFLEWVS